MTPADVLRGAAAKIEKQGWFQGTDLRSDLPQDQRPLCANLAMDAVVGKVRSQRDPVTLRYSFTSPEMEARYNTFVAAQSSLITFLGLPPRDIPIGSKIVEWNDEPGRTQTEVVAALRDVLIHDRKTSPEDPILKAYRLGQLDMAQQILSQEANRRADDDTVTIGRQHSALLRPLIQGERTLAAIAIELGLTISEVRADYMILYRKGIVHLDNHNGATTFASLTPTIGRLLARDLELETEHG